MRVEKWREIDEKSNKGYSIEEFQSFLRYYSDQSEEDTCKLWHINSVRNGLREKSSTSVITHVFG
jgi:hypothetical protein